MINAAVLGSPITHSLSPLLHSLAYEHLGLIAHYEAIEVKAGALDEFMSRTEKNCLSLTMPLKEEALSVADSISEIAEQVSCGNTLMLKNGSWSLTSTDVAGFDHAFMMHGVKQCDSVLIIGAGATARAAMASVSKISKDIAVVSRNPERMAAMNKASDKEVRYLPWEITSAINSASLVINTTPTLAADVFAPSIEKPQGVFFEVLYNPWPTHLAKTWSQSGAHVIDGLDLLIHQAISQVEIFAGFTCDRDLFYRKMRDAAAAKLS